MADRRVVITGVSVFSPLGLELSAFWQALVEGKSGIRPFVSFDATELPVRFGGELPGFDAKKSISGKEERKSIKMMSRTIQIGVACALAAFHDSRIDRKQLDSTRFGVEFGSSLIPTDLDDLVPAATLSTTDIPNRVDMQVWGHDGIPTVAPLWMLKYLPNMVACHTSIFLDAQGPNNSITETDISALLALGEAFRILRRDQADFFLCGASDSKMTLLSLVRQCLFAELSKRNDAPDKASRPFDKNRDGWVVAEGAGVLALEDLAHAQRRGATIYGEILGFGSAYDRGLTGSGLARAIHGALTQAGISPQDVDHVNAHGQSTRVGDAWEARGIAAVFGRDTPVFAPKSYFGSLSSASGAAELTASLLAYQHGTLPPTLNYETPDPECPVSVLREARPIKRPYFVKISVTERGQCAAAIVKRFEG